MATATGKQAAVDESKVQELVGLLEESVAVFDKAGAESKLYSYLHYIENRILNKMPKEENIDPQEMIEFVKLYKPRLPGKVSAEPGRRILAYYVGRAERLPIYEEIVEFLDLQWAFGEDGARYCCDAIDKEFLDSTFDEGMEVEVIGGYENPFMDVDISIALGPADAEEARRLIALAETVNAARAEWRCHQDEIDCQKASARYTVAHPELHTDDEVQNALAWIDIWKQEDAAMKAQKQAA